MERDWQKDWELCRPHGGCVTPPPWKVEGKAVWYKGVVAWHPLVSGSRCTSYDLQFIAEAREALPYWLQRVRELEAQINEERLLHQQQERVAADCIKELHSEYISLLAATKRWHDTHTAWVYAAETSGKDSAEAQQCRDEYEKARMELIKTITEHISTTKELEEHIRKLETQLILQEQGLPVTEKLNELRDALLYWLSRVEELEAQCAVMREALEELANAPPIFADERLDYVEIQVAKASLGEAQKILSGDAGRELLERVKKLEKENQLLQKVLEVKGISYNDALIVGKHLKEMEATIEVCVDTECRKCYNYGTCDEETNYGCGIYKLKKIIKNTKEAINNVRA